MKKVYCLKCHIIEPDHTTKMQRVSNKDALPVPGFNVNFYQCMSTGGFKAPFQPRSGAPQQGEGRFMLPQRQMR